MVCYQWHMAAIQSIWRKIVFHAECWINRVTYSAVLDKEIQNVEENKVLQLNEWRISERWTEWCVFSHISHSSFSLNHLKHFHPFRHFILFIFLLWENDSQDWNVGIWLFIDSKKKIPFHNCNAILIYVDECLHGLWMFWNSFSSSFFLGRFGMDDEMYITNTDRSGWMKKIIVVP